jgi:3-hydroxybutyryl-CoA dehydrogenase
MDIEDIRCVLIIGAGTMGQQIALLCAMHGYEVIVYDTSAKALETATATIKTYAEQLVSQKRLPPDEANAALARISFTTNPEEAAKADLLSESIPEDPDLKAKVFAQFNKICPPHTIFTTNTSTLVPSMYADATGRPGQFAALHFHNYVWDANLADIMPHSGTFPETIKLLYAFAKRIGQVPLVLEKESPEYVFNSIFGAINKAAITLLFNGIASVEDVDRAWMIIMKMPVRPFGMLDGVGLDTVWHIMQCKAQMSGDPQQQAVADRWKAEYLDKGRLGVKTSRGFYTYPDPAYARSDFLNGETN